MTSSSPVIIRGSEATPSRTKRAIEDLTEAGFKSGRPKRSGRKSAEPAKCTPDDEALAWHAAAPRKFMQKRPYGDEFRTALIEPGAEVTAS